MAEKIDVLICGGGPAGLCAGMWLARCGIPFAILERRPGALAQGQADGVQCRTVEVFESFGLAELLLREACHVLEVAFWAAAAAAPTTTTTTEEDPDGRNGDAGDTGIRRSHCAADTEPGLSHLPHVILAQARVNGLMTEEICRAAGRDPIRYGYEVTGVGVDTEAAEDPKAYCCTVTARKDGVEHEFRAKYVLGCDGAHSTVRRSLGIQMVGDSRNAVWGVMDVYPRTNFPDIRKKTIIHAREGSLIIIPREGDALVRFYTELPGTAAAADLRLEDLHARARLIFRPYELDIAETAWWSAYAVGQRCADGFARAGRVFLTGDACHTHSPKAGQGMNVSLQDGYNLGWKLAAVLRGRAAPALLGTYVAERQQTAQDLIAFDRHFTNLFSTAYRREHGITPAHFREQFVQAGRYTAGLAYRYEDSLVVSSAGDPGRATAVRAGMRFPSAQVVRFCDARAMALVKGLPADGRWHIVAFAGDIREPEAAERLRECAEGLQKMAAEFTPAGADPDSVFHPVLVLAGRRTKTDLEQIPPVFTPETGKWKIKCLFNIFVDDESYNSGHGHAYKAYGVDPKRGALVIVRPDHYTARIGSLEDTPAVRTFFGGFMR